MFTHLQEAKNARMPKAMSSLIAVDTENSYLVYRLLPNSGSIIKMGSYEVNWKYRK